MLKKRAVQKDGHNLQIDYAKTEFKQVREIFGNSGSTQAYASRLAFSPDEFNLKKRKRPVKSFRNCQRSLFKGLS